MMVTRPSCVLLDEPTNHLDEPAMELAGGLPGLAARRRGGGQPRSGLPGPGLHRHRRPRPQFRRHRRRAGGRRFGGGFSRYLDVRADARSRWERDYLEQQQEIAELRRQAAIDTSAIAPGRGPRDNDKFIYNFKGSKVDRAVSRRVKDADPSVGDRRTRTGPQAAGRRCVSPGGSRGRAGMLPSSPGRPSVVTDLEVAGRVACRFWSCRRGGRLLLTGANGSGKSTLLNVFSGRLAADRGAAVEIAAGRVGMLDQDVVFDDPVGVRPADLRTRRRPGRFGPAGRSGSAPAPRDRLVRSVISVSGSGAGWAWPS